MNPTAAAQDQRPIPGIATAETGAWAGNGSGLKARLWGLLIMMVGGSAMLAASVLINRAVKFERSQAPESAAVQFKMQPIEKAKVKSSQSSLTQATKRSRKSSSARFNAAPGIALPGLDFGLNLGQQADLEANLEADQGLGGDDAVMSTENLDTEPRPVKTDPVEYPSEARDKKIAGFVSVNILINDQGRVEKVLVQESEPKGIFDQAVVSSVKNWQFEPGKYKGKSVKVWASQRIVFEGT